MDPSFRWDDDQGAEKKGDQQGSDHPRILALRPVYPVAPISSSFQRKLESILLSPLSLRQPKTIRPIRSVAVHSARVAGTVLDCCPAMAWFTSRWPASSCRT